MRYFVDVVNIFIQLAFSKGETLLPISLKVLEQKQRFLKKILPQNGSIYFYLSLQPVGLTYRLGL